MRAYERNGVTVDQCTDCRGVFLDRGELERLIDAETGYYEKPREPERRYDERKYDTDEHRFGRSGGYSDKDYKKRRRTSFLSELFD
jgi:Zn-finger nucleic acid-binding protein